MSTIGNTTVSFSEEQAMLMDVAREFCRDKSPIGEVRAQLETDTGFDNNLWSEMVNLGWTGIALPEGCGGSGLGVAALVPVFEAMGRAMLGTPLMATSLAAQLLLRAAGESRGERWLASIAGGTIATIALLDGGDWGAENTRLVLGEDGVLSGAKRYVQDAGVAQLFVVVANRQGDPALAVVRRDQLADTAFSENTLIDRTRRAANVDFSGVQVAPEDVIEGAAVAAALRDVQLLGALLVAAETTGSAGACLDTIVEYLTTRKQFGKLIGSYQALKHPTVDILVSVDSSRSFIYHAASIVGVDALDRDAEIACRMAKAQATEALLYAGDRAVQFHGGMGFTWECDAQLYIRRAQWAQQQFGDARHHRKRLAALLLD